MAGLHEPLRAGAWTLPNRILMAALTRVRAGPTHVANALMAEYYAQRASAGLIITEATMIARDGCAFMGEGGLYDDATVAGWRHVTEGVHRRGGRILVQLWHPGRAAHSALNGGVQPVSSTDRAIRDATTRTSAGRVPYERPRRLEAAEIPAFIALFRRGAELAREARFDGVQVHGGHGYLVDQFLRDGANDREDAWGGPIERRARFLLEAVDAACAVLGPDRVAVRISPLVAYNDMADSDPPALVEHVATELGRRQLAFLELRHAVQGAPEERELARIARARFGGVLVRNGGFDPSTARASVMAGEADAIAFGTLFVSNPDLPARIAGSAALAAADPATFYTPGPRGYTDYPPLGG
jgi:N-ethylmaleimide reductase